MKLRTGEPWMTAPDYGRSLRGLTVNILVAEIDAALRFQREVLGAEVVYSDPDIAVLRLAEAEWMLHADHTYEDHPFRVRASKSGGRGDGVELRIHGCDPDRAEAEARRLGYAVLESATDKPHGLRESFIVDGDGYIWVPDVHSRSD
jgi:catechol 2,3-dioxygenase-like lactoylglutathione lyase family enzyme